MVSQEDLIIPVYLNQRVVFDLVAMLRGGIASITQVTQSQKESGSAHAEVQTKFGLSNALASLVRVDLGAKVGGATSGQSAETLSEQRVHTPASLFITLRALLRKSGYIAMDSGDLKPQPGDIVEFSASLRRNPLHETLGALLEFMNMADALVGSPSKGKQDGSAGTHKARKQVESFLSSLVGGETFDLTTAPLACGYRSVVTLERQYLNDPTMSDLIDGTFRIVGKVTRAIGKDQGAISLNRKSALGRLPTSMIAPLAEALKGPKEAGFALPDMEWEIGGPVLHVLPIAIFA